MTWLLLRAIAPEFIQFALVRSDGCIDKYLLITLNSSPHSFDKLLAKYDNYIKNYDAWDYETRCHHWQRGRATTGG